jgi:magnesium transporter
MPSDLNRVLVESIKRRPRRKAFPNLRKIVEKTHAADPSIIFSFVLAPSLFGL